MMEHALLNDESESGRSWGLGRRDLGVEEVWKARGEQRAVSLMGADSPSTLSVKGEKGLCLAQPLLASPGLCSPGVLKEIQSTLEGDRG